MEAQTPSALGVEKPSGPVAAVILAAGIGALALGILTTWAEASTGLAEWLEFSKRVGPLSGKTDLATTAFLVSWLGLGLGLRGKNVDLRKVTAVSVILIVLGLIGTFPEFFLAFAPDE